MPEFGQPAVQVGGPSHLEFEFFAGDWVIEGQGGRVEGLTRCTARILDERSIGTLAVDRIATEQVSGFG